MKNVIKLTILALLCVFWAYYGSYVQQWGWELNALTSIPVFGYAFWGLYGASVLYLSLDLLKMVHEAIKGKKIVNLFIIVVILLLVYFTSDIIDKGKTLNGVTPYPILGYAFWALIVWFVYWQVFAPIITFAQLRNLHSQTLYQRAKWSYNQLCREVKIAEKENRLDEEKETLHDNLSNAIQLKDEENMAKYLDEYYQIIDKQANKIILNCSKIASIAAVVSRNKWMDSAALIYMQARMIVALSKLYGGKPSPIFNLLSLGWIAVSSGVYLVMQGLIVENAEALANELADELAENIMDDPEIQANALKSTFSLTSLTQVVSSVASVLLGPALEASAAGANVYVTGKMFLWKLKGDAKAASFKEYLKERRYGRWFLTKELIKKGPGLNQFKQALSGGIETLVTKDKSEA